MDAVEESYRDIKVESPRSHPEVLRLEAGYLGVPPAHVPEEVDAGVDVLQRVDGLVQRAHHLLGVLLQLLALLLRLARLQVLEGFEQVQQLLVLLEQSKGGKGRRMLNYWKHLSV